MGWLSVGTPLNWTETQKYTEHVRRQGGKQFISQYKKSKDRDNDPLLWGDEVEYMFIKLEPETKTAKIALKSWDILSTLQKQEEKDSNGKKLSIWHPEYADFVIEGLPGEPYGGSLLQLTDVEDNMIRRKNKLKTILEPNCFAVTITYFPRFGTVNSTAPAYQPTPNAGIFRSMFLPDQIIFPRHPRFRAMSLNFAERRTDKVAANIPVYKDIYTKSSFLDDISIYEDAEEYSSAKPQHIYLDSFGFGMSICTLQVTIQFRNITEAMRLYDELYQITPVMLALSAGAPIYRGYLSDVDSCWAVSNTCCDDRSREERGCKPLKHNKYRISKSRLDTLDSYLSACHQRFNDTEIEFDPGVYSELVAEGVHEPLAKHIANLFLRDPLCLFEETIHQNVDEETDHFDNLLATNYKPLKFRLPDPDNNIGWRVEFRPMEVQLTDFENAAYVVFVVLVTRVILTYGLSFVIPISKVNENYNNSYLRDAVLTGKFYFRKDIYNEFFDQSKTGRCDMKTIPSEIANNCKNNNNIECTRMTIDQIINGSDEFPGLVPIVCSYVNNIDFDENTRNAVRKYMDVISKRASGELPTNARWMRDFVASHSDYKQDSVVSDIINFDLMKTCVKIQDRNNPAMSP